MGRHARVGHLRDARDTRARADGSVRVLQGASWRAHQLTRRSQLGKSKCKEAAQCSWNGYVHVDSCATHLLTTLHAEATAAAMRPRRRPRRRAPRCRRATRACFSSSTRGALLTSRGGRFKQKVGCVDHSHPAQQQSDSRHRRCCGQAFASGKSKVCSNPAMCKWTGKAVRCLLLPRLMSRSGADSAHDGSASRRPRTRPPSTSTKFPVECWVFFKKVKQGFSDIR